MKFDILKPQSTSGTGRKAIQEDSVFPALGEGTIHDKLFIVADGHGGEGKGFEASESFCQAVSDYFFQNTCPDEPFTDEMLDEALLNAASAMERRCPDSEGTSFAMLYLHRHGVLAAHVGSSVIYHVRPKERTILYRSAEDSRAFVPGQGQRTEPTRAHIVNVQYGDYFVLLTQGAKACISDSRLLEIFCEPVNDNTKLLRMVKLLSDCPDNYSITIVHVSGVMNEAMDEHLVEDVVSAAVASQVASPVQGETRAVEEGVKKPAAESPVGRKEQTGPSRTAPQKPRPQRKDPPKRPARREDDDFEEGSDKGGFPVVLVTALLIVALGMLAWWWMRRSTQREDVETPAIEVKKDSVKKDTVNIMKGERPKPLNLEEEKKKEETKKEQPQQKQEEKASETEQSEYENIDNPVNPDNSVTVPATDDNVTQPQQQQPAEEFKSEVTPVPTPDPGTVTPRPVIPEGE